MQELGGDPVAGAGGHQRELVAGAHSLLGEPVHVQLVGSIGKGIERPELAHQDATVDILGTVSLNGRVVAQIEILELR